MELRVQVIIPLKPPLNTHGTDLIIPRCSSFGSGSGSEAEGDEHVCGKCRAEFPTLSDFLSHKKVCVSKRPVLVAPLLDVPLDTDDEDDNESSEYDPVIQLDNADMPFSSLQEWLQENSQVQSMLLEPRGPNTNVTIAHLENTSVAVAQLGPNGTPLNDLVSTLHQNQIEQLEILKVIAKIVQSKDTSGNAPPLIGTAALTPFRIANSIQAAGSASSSASAACATAAYPQGGRTQDSPLDSLPPTEDSLALLQKHTERYIQDSMSRKSFLNGMDDDSRSKRNKDLDPALRHKCHFCGKLLGSDSALQIHLRSHTGEKPFQCNVCGSAFSTRGNLKVHFQRHKERMELPNFVGNEPKQSDGRPSLEVNGRPENPPTLFPSTSNDRDLSKGEQALDFSKAVNGRKSPQGETHSRSVSPNDTSNFSDNSLDGSSDDNIPNENFSHLKIDVERSDDEDGDNSNCMDDDESEVASSQPSFTTSPNFAPYFLPYDQYPSTSQITPGNGTITNNSVNNNNAGPSGENNDILQDPNYYQDLLPRIGSNDNSWESLIEVTKTSETSKLQQLVDNIENKLIEPNQCILCQRVLSCKSALQMHYRTHTGERPYKCKLCSRAFTTKGNLKTHMGVHRTKTPTRPHQCPVCHSQFQNPILLQQHVANHTSDHVLHLPPMYNPCDDRPPTLLPPSYPKQFLAQSRLVNAEPLALTSSKAEEERRKSISLPPGESVIKPTRIEHNISQVTNGSPMNSPKSSCSPSSNTDETPVEKESKSTILSFAQSEADSPLKNDINSTDDSLKIDGGSPGSEKDRMETCIPVDMKSDAKSSLNHDTEGPSPIQSPKRDDIKIPSNVSDRMLSKFSSQSNSLMVSLASDRPLPMTLPSDCPIPFSVHGSDRHYPPISIPSCGTNYTESLTALENHVKAISSNVTHPLPFPPHFGLGLNMSNYFRDYNYPQKPSPSPTTSKNGSDASADDRSTPGGIISNGKGESPRSTSISNQVVQKSDGTNGTGALDLTPRSSPAFHRPAPTAIKLFEPLAGLPFAAPPHRLSTTCRVCFKTFACNSALEIHYRSHTKERPFRCEVCDRGFSTKGNMRQHMLTHKIRDFPPQAFSTNSNSNPSPSSSNKGDPTSGEKPKKLPDETPPPPPPAKRPTTEPLPTPKRAPGQPKHMCQVCNKPFSSGSALQIHMRTHSGEKPFECNICRRAFTTKGNLKVHMGTHMWNNSTSRRGRRMSLEINQFQTQPGCKPGEFRPPPFFPYLAPFINGLPPHQPPPKMNEISVIQTAGMGNGAVCNAPSVTTNSAPSTSQQPLALLSANKQGDREDAHQNQNSHSQGKDILLPSSNQEVAASWPWKISCNVCNKICASSSELENHLRSNHSKKDSSETDRTD
ncbi:sal-like protein 3 [Trichonephila inaurata madagascariensis]|uniref:Sal-like protein 3 n=1 Tax=Trichonephila inaurata madagascariensis TaxID=2747483 RepID=A0A8X6XWF2_9ARAC|nr:sal-like protein 3 [Trichonephila inaurata madagascariensis]